MSFDNTDESRRSVLKKVAAGAVASVAFAGGAGAVPSDAVASRDGFDPDREVGTLDVSTSDCSCEYEYKCEDTCYKDGSYQQLYKRECCTCDGDTVCEDTWTRADRCCL